jgi:hypothetical protein
MAEFAGTSPDGGGGGGGGGGGSGSSGSGSRMITDGGVGAAGGAVIVAGADETSQLAEYDPCRTYCITWRGTEGDGDWATRVNCGAEDLQDGWEHHKPLCADVERLLNASVVLCIQPRRVLIRNVTTFSRSVTTALGPWPRPRSFCSYHPPRRFRAFNQPGEPGTALFNVEARGGEPLEGPASPPADWPTARAPPAF